MSQSKTNEVTLMRIEIGMDSETKTAFQEFKDKYSEALARLAAVKPQQASGGLLDAMKAEADNDNTATERPDNCEVELKQMGQWVFAGQDDKWQSGGVDCHGRGYLFACKKETLLTPMGTWVIYPTQQWRFIGNDFDSSNWQQSLINRQTVNDVDYLTEDKSETDGLKASEIITDGIQSSWLSESVPRITETDLQLIFIKNLSTTLIQRMHSMDRFSEDDYHIGGDKLMLWDIVIYEPLNTYAVLIGSPEGCKLADLLFFWNTGAAVDDNWNTESAAFKVLRTITQDELNDFRQALEVCYAKSK